MDDHRAQDVGRLAYRHWLTRRFRRIERLTILAVLAGLAWRIIRYAQAWPLWGDEGFVAMNFMLRDFAGMVRAPLEYGQIVPLGFLWAELGIVRVLGISEWSLRLLPLLCGLVSLVLFWRFAHRILDRHAALLAVAAMAAAFYPVRHCGEIKPYAGDMLVGLVLTWLAWSLVKRPDSTGRWVALCLIAAGGVWFFYPTVFVASGLGIYLAWEALRRRSRRLLMGLAAFALVAGASFLAMYLLYARPHAEANPWYWTIQTWKDAFPPIDRPWLMPWWLLEIHCGNMLAYPFGGNHFASTGTFLLVLVGCVVLWRSRRRDLLLLLLCPLITTFLAAAMRKYPYGTSARISLYMAPAFCILAGLGASTLLRRCLPRRLAPEAFRVAGIALVLAVVVAIVLNVIWPYKTLADEDNRAAIREVAAQTSPADRWIIANALGDTKDSPALTGTEAVTFRFYVTLLSPAPVQWAPPPSQVAPAAGRTWLLYFADPEAADQEHRARTFDAYRRTLTECLGLPRRQTFTLRKFDPKHPSPIIEVYEFPGRP